MTTKHLLALLVVLVAGCDSKQLDSANEKYPLEYRKAMRQSPLCVVPGCAPAEVHKSFGDPSFTDAHGTEWYEMTAKELESNGLEGKEGYLRIHYRNGASYRYERVSVDVFKTFPAGVKADAKAAEETR